MDADETDSIMSLFFDEKKGLYSPFLYAIIHFVIISINNRNDYDNIRFGGSTYE